MSELQCPECASGNVALAIYWPWQIQPDYDEWQCNVCLTVWREDDG